MLSEVEQFYLEQDQRFNISDGDSDDDSLPGMSTNGTRNIHSAITAPGQKQTAINVAGWTYGHLASHYRTGDPAQHEQYRTGFATGHVGFGEYLPAHTERIASKKLKRKHSQELDPVRVEDHVRKHPRNLQHRDDAVVFSPKLYGNDSPSGKEGDNRDAAANIIVGKPTKSHSVQFQAAPSGDQAAVGLIIPATPSGTLSPPSVVSGRLRAIDANGPAEPDQIRKTPKLDPLLSNTTGEAGEIIDLTLDFTPQLTSTQVTAGPARKAKLRAEGKTKVSNHASRTPRRDKVIKITAGAGAGPSGLTHTKAPSSQNASVSISTHPVKPSIPSAAAVSKPASQDVRRPAYSSNITTPASSNPLDVAAVFPSLSIFDEPSSSKLDSKGGRSRREIKPTKETKQPKGKGKDKPALVTPLEYARKLQEALQTAYQKPNKRSPQYLKGKKIFYIGGDMQYAGERTRNRMAFIVKHGGTLLPTYDASIVTHIVTDAPRQTTLRALGLRTLDEIPDHVPTLKWEWVPSGLSRASNLVEKDGEEAEVEVEMDDVCMHAAFLKRYYAGAVRYGKASKGKGKAKAKAETVILDEADEFSRISDFTQEPLNQRSGSPIDPSSKSSNPLPAPTVVADAKDPLAEFYALARAEVENAWSTYRDENSDDEMSDPGQDALPSEQAPARGTKRGFTCDNKEVQSRLCVNQDVVDKLQELMELHKSKPSDDDRWRAFSYGKCLRGLRNYPKRITSYAEARSIRGVGDKTALKIMEILQTGDLRRIGYERTEDVEATKVFQGIYGVGQSTAFKWYASGCRTLEDVKARKGGIKLSTVQEIGVQFYDDINDRMPRAEAEAIFQHIKPLALAIDPKLSVGIMGSFRRGKADCGDIDVLITRPVDDGKNHVGVLKVLLRELHGIGLLTEDLALPEDWDDLECSYRGLCRLPHEGKRRRRIDILTVPWESRGAALLYYTGDDIFNRAMRFKAGTMGYSLNQRGLYGGVVRDPRDRKKKLNTGVIVASETEEEIFQILEVPWQEPHERVRG